MLFDQLGMFTADKTAFSKLVTVSRRFSWILTYILHLRLLLHLRFRNPTNLVYVRADVLRVRKLFNYQYICKYHKTIITFLLDQGKRIDKCPVPRARSTFAQQHYHNIAPRLYNKLNLRFIQESKKWF